MHKNIGIFDRTIPHQHLCIIKEALDVSFTVIYTFLISSAQSKRMTAYLQCLKETYCDPGEIIALEWKEIKGNIITIAHPCKGHYAGQYEVSNRLISMINRLPKKDKRVFPTTYQVMRMCLNALKKKAARKQQNPALLDITFRSFRHWGVP